MKVLETERMLLRLMREEDSDNLLQIFSDSEAMRYYPSTKDLEETRSWIRWTRKNYKEHGIGLWIAELRETNEFVGQCGLIPQEIEGELEIEIGYLFVRKHWGKGLATEAAAACKDYGFNQLGYNRLISTIDKNNEASKRVATRVGLHFEKEIFKWNKPIEVYSVNNKE
ncbi:GNAT family N-acetyltransferase [Priestia aryabhattai]|uniref:GNAT family N-acetyltransferase n=1 Tax=Priestia TaxID=2800373 RepID=UPI003001123F